MTYTDINKWNKEFDTVVERTITGHKRLIGTAAKLFKKDVAERTPIGHPWEWKTPPHSAYVPGALRNAWAVEQLSEWNWVVYNDRPYAYRVETGWSKQAPMGMMRLAVIDWSEKIKYV